jgi:hypothetical protein
MLSVINQMNYPAALNVYVAGHVWCYDVSESEHGRCLGMAYTNGKPSVVDASQARTDGDLGIVRTLAHELVHNFGCPDVDNDTPNAQYACSGERRCVLWDYYDSYAEMSTMI